MKEEQTNLGLTIPNDLAYLPAALNFTREVAARMGFGPEEQRHIELAVEEAAANVIEHAFAPGEKASFNIRFKKMATGLEVTIHDKGLPFDPTLVADYRPDAGLDEQGAAGLGSFLMKSVIDEVQFLNLGFQGKETRLFKRFSYAPFAASEEEIKHRTEQEAEPPAVQDQPKAEVEVEVRQMRSRDAIEVSRCFFDVYGYSYIGEHAYFPERLAALNESGDLFSAIAVTAEGEVASHGALSFSKFYPGIGEVCMGATKKKFRGQALTQKLNIALYEEAARRQLSGLFSETVTVHTRSQHLVRRFGFKETAFHLAYGPASMSFKGIAEDLESRVALLIYFVFLHPVDGTTLKIHPPTAHAEMIRKIYKNFGIEAEIIPPAGESFDDQPTLMEMVVNNGMGLAVIRFFHYGNDIDRRVREALYRVKHEGLQVAHIYLNLSDPLTPAVGELLEKYGFIFTGILPGVTGGDLVGYQYFNGILVGYEGIHTDSDMGQELLAYIRSQDILGGSTSAA
jgi:anti-sigma regulatory factor (Ser/Thr protein kinase)/ribosomal protein S18 acetylase RimI-like enzyme